MDCTCIHRGEEIIVCPSCATRMMSALLDLSDQSPDFPSVLTQAEYQGLGFLMAGIDEYFSLENEVRL